MKVCTKCGEEKDEKEFYKKSERLYRSECKKCYCTIKKEYRQKNRQSIASYWANYYKRNKPRISERNREWLKKTEYTKKRYFKEKDTPSYKKAREKWVKNNPDKVKNYKKNWYSEPEIMNKNKEKQKMWRDELNQNYIKSLLRNKGFTRNQLEDHAEIIELQKIIIKTKRLCQKSQTSKN